MENWQAAAALDVHRDQPPQVPEGRDGRMVRSAGDGRDVVAERVRAHKAGAPPPEATPTQAPMELMRRMAGG